MGTQIDPKEMSATTLRRIEQNDPSVHHLHIALWTEALEDVAPEEMEVEGVGNYFISSPVLHTVNLQRLGDAIGGNTRLDSIFFNDNSAVEARPGEDSIDGLFDGLQRSTSIRHMAMAKCDIGDRCIGLDILRGCALNGSLTRISLDFCALGGRGLSAVRQVVGCSRLEKIRLEGCNIDDRILEDLVSETNLLQVQNLDLERNHIGLAGCHALASLLRDSRCKLQSLCLDNNNNIDDDCVKVIARSLTSNKMLQYLFLRNNDSITIRGWLSCFRALCDPSSVSTMYDSNHSLKYLATSNIDDAYAGIALLLKLNEDLDKRRVATRKILLLRSHIDMGPFLEWELKALPLAVNWFDRARSMRYAGDERLNVAAQRTISGKIGAMKLSALYQFARALPLMVVPSKKGSKRKLDEAHFSPPA